MAGTFRTLPPNPHNRRGPGHRITDDDAWKQIGASRRTLRSQSQRRLVSCARRVGTKPTTIPHETDPPVGPRRSAILHWCMVAGWSALAAAIGAVGGFRLYVFASGLRLFDLHGAAQPLPFAKAHLSSLARVGARLSEVASCLALLCILMGLVLLADAGCRRSKSIREWLVPAIMVLLGGITVFCALEMGFIIVAM